MVSCFFCKRSIQTRKELALLSFPIWKSLSPLPVHLDCYINRIGKDRYEYVIKFMKYAPFFMPSLKFLFDNGVPIDYKKQRIALLQVIGLLAPFYVVALYLVFLLPVLLLATFPILVLTPVFLIIQFYRVRLCKKIEKSLSLK